MRGLLGCFCGQRICFIGTNSTRQRNVATYWAMLTKMVERFDPYQYRVREGAQALTDPLEDDDDDEHEDD